MPIKLILNDVDRDCYLSYVSNVFTDEILAQWFDIILYDAKWEQKYRGDKAYRNNTNSNYNDGNKYASYKKNGMPDLVDYIRKVPRLVAWYTYDNDCHCIYKYGSIACKAIEWPQWMQVIMYYVLGVLIMKCEGKYGYLLQYPPNSCNINLYRDGEDCAGWHVDDEHLFRTEYV